MAAAATLDARHPAWRKVWSNSSDYEGRRRNSPVDDLYVVVDRGLTRLCDGGSSVGVAAPTRPTT